LLLLTPKEKEKGIEDYRHIVDANESDDKWFDTHTISGTLIIETLFVADYKTRFKHFMFDDTSEFDSPESFIHY